MKYVILEKAKKPISKEQLQKIIDRFVPFCKKYLGLKSIPKIEFSTSEEAKEIKSFGQHKNEANKISLKVEDRHPMDILRTLAHELVHHKQDAKESKESGSSYHGSKKENEANKEAGIIVRKFAMGNASIFALGSVK